MPVASPHSRAMIRATLDCHMRLAALIDSFERLRAVAIRFDTEQADGLGALARFGHATSGGARRVARDADALADALARLARSAKGDADA